MSQSAADTIPVRDFSDRVSPMLVKELRQGLRTRVFTFAFIFVQGFMILFMLAGLGPNANPDELSGLFWSLLLVVLFVVIPLRGLGALSSEIRLKTMDLISLTSMTPWRIVTGKWASVVSQAVLLIVAILPYIVLRYFFGGVDIISELTGLFVGLMGCMVMCAFTVGVSAFPNALVRTLVSAGIVILTLSVFLRMFLMAFSGSASFSVINDWRAWTAIVALAVFLILYFFDMAATRIAPEAFNYSLRKRILGLIAILTLVALYFFAGESYLPFAFILTSLVAADALTEKLSSVRRLHLGFFRRGPFGNLAHAFFTPGWPSGVCYTLLLSVLLAGAAVAGSLDWGGDFEDAGELAILTLAFVNMLLFPLIFVPMVTKDAANSFPVYLLIQLATWAVSGFIRAIGENASLDVFMFVGLPLPPLCMILIGDSYGDELGIVFIVSLVVLLFLLQLLWRRARPYRRFLTEIRREAAESPDTSSSSSGPSLPAAAS